MLQDQYLLDTSYTLPEIDHAYGKNIHILKDPLLLTLTEKISRDDIVQPLFTEYVKKAYQGLFNHIASSIFSRAKVESKTRMFNIQKEGIFSAEIIDPDLKVVCVDLARAGMIPSQLIYTELNYLLNPKNIRQDHFYAARKTNAKDEVIGIDISGSKIGGDIEDRIVIFPDPMGATGGTIAEAITHYKKNVDGKAKKFITAHLMITPEYIKTIQKHHPDCEVFAIRLDRGLSTANALASKPGTYPDEEKGLNEHSYIVPGAGGVGELLNNSFV